MTRGKKREEEGRRGRPEKQESSRLSGLSNGVGLKLNNRNLHFQDPRQRRSNTVKQNGRRLSRYSKNSEGIPKSSFEVIKKDKNNSWAFVIGG